MFPRANSGWYMVGSHADGTALDLSDVDLVCLADPLVPDMNPWAADAEHRYSKVDIYLRHPSDLNRVLSAHIPPMLRIAVHLQGKDFRPGLPPLDLRAYQETVGFQFGKAVSFFHPGGVVAGPPESGNEFLGFVGPAKKWTGLEIWTHAVVVLVSRAATAVGATRGLIAGSRGESLEQMNLCAGMEEWAAFCNGVVSLLRDQWHYRVPQGAAQRDQLRIQCSRLCDLERAVLAELELAGIDPFRDGRPTLRTHSTAS